MKIYKLFFQLLREHSTAIILNTLLLLAVVIPVNAIYNSSFNAQFEVEKSDVGIINQDGNHPVTHSFIAYMENTTNVVPLEEDPEEIADALYYQKADYVLTIPEGFGQSTVDTGQGMLPLEKTVTQNPQAEAFVDTVIERYLMNLQFNTVRIINPEDTGQLTQMLDNLNRQLEQSSVDIVPAEQQTNVSMLAFGTNFVHFVTYVMISTFITVFGYVTVAMRNPEVTKRDRMGMLTQRNRLVQLLAGCITFSTVYWMLLMGAATIIYGPDTIFSERGMLLVLNSFLSMFGIQAMAYFAATVANTKGAVSFLSTLLSLLLAFSSGVFVPREVVHPVMQRLASFATPIWQVKAGEIIMNTRVLTFEHLEPAFQMMGIQVLIGITFYLISFVLQKYRSQQSVY